MSTTTPAKRFTGLPTPGRQSASALPTPDTPDAMKYNNPLQLRQPSRPNGLADSTSGSPLSLPRKSYGLARPNGAATRPDSRASSAAESHSLGTKTPTTPGLYAPRSSTASNASSYATSIHSRPDSRQSDAGYSQYDIERMQAGKWLVGDPVRIESLGMEGTLRFLGPIEGKNGVFAGVELFEGYHGKGKNDGSVAGVRYFTCPPMAGVFTHPSKLSLSTVKALPPRAPSVASTRSAAHSVTSGRVTPSSSRSRPPPKTPTNRKPQLASSVTSSIAASAGSRANKYVGMTAKQLSIRGTTSSPSVGSGTASPVHPSTTAITPKASKIGPAYRGKLATGLTPKAKTGVPFPGTAPSSSLPSVPAPRFFSGSGDQSSPSRKLGPMMPPPSPRRHTLDKPVTPTLSQTSTDTYVDGPDLQHISELGRPMSSSSSSELKSLEANNRALQEKIANLMGGKKSPSSSGLSSPPTHSLNAAALSTASTPSLLGSPPPSKASDRLLQIQCDRLKLRIEALEKDNELLKNELELKNTEPPSTPPSETTPVNTAELDVLKDELEKLKAEHEGVLSKLQTSQQAVESHLRDIKEKEAKIDTLNVSAKETSSRVDALEGSLKETQSKLKDSEELIKDKDSLISTLKEAVDAKASKEDETASALRAKDAEIELLESRIQKLMADFEEEKKYLNSQVNELRLAGQETIALYEERLSLSESQRFEMEELYQEMEGKLQAKENQPLNPQQASAAAVIENESLKEQAVHLQKKISSLEDLVEDMKVAAERDEAAVKARIARFRESEAALKNEVDALRGEMDRLVKAEATATRRVEEVEEALRESDAALENARAEIEGMRFELTANGGLETGGHTRTRTDASKNDAAEKQPQLEATASEDVTGGCHKCDDLIIRLEALEREKEDLQIAHTAAIASERKQRLGVEERVSELEAMLNVGLKRESSSGSSPNGVSNHRELLPQYDTKRDSKRDSTASNSSKMSKRSVDPTLDENLKEQVTGLKHINAELRKENAAVLSQHKVLQSENKLLQSEMEELRESVRSLEDTLQKSIEQEENKLSEVDKPLDSKGASSESDGSVNIDALRAEIDQLQKRINEMEKEHTKVVLALNKDILDLENLVEAKIYREDDLEREIERLKEKLSKRRSSKSSIESSSTSHQRPSSLVSNDLHHQPHHEEDVESGACELCGEKGHDIVSCEIAFSDKPSLSLNSTSPSDSHTVKEDVDDLDVDVDMDALGGGDLWCDECEVLGDHVTEDCPHAMDVF
ncbi:hypothetical protein FRC03_011829 [Tulasnella sp. 419]|nr:hypothetical protein FRC03_011829 [Tulasnella sp. 419]